MLKNTLLVGAGGFLGASARYLVGLLVSRLMPPVFPFATMLVNVAGCLAIGFLAVLVDERFGLGPSTRLFWMIGILGGYTTFSTFGYETVLLVRAGSHAAALVNIAGQVVLGLLAVWAGAEIARGL